MKLISIESPYAGDVARNEAYARAAMRFVLEEGHSPYASHLLITQVLDDTDPEQRARGIAAGIEMGNSCDERWLFWDFGMTPGMELAATAAQHLGQPVRFVNLPGWGS